MFTRLNPLFEELDAGAPEGAAAPESAPAPTETQGQDEQAPAPTEDELSAGLLEAVTASLDEDAEEPAAAQAKQTEGDKAGAPEAPQQPDLATLTAMPEGIRGEHRRAFKQLADYATQQQAAVQEATQKAQQMEQRVSAFSELVQETSAQPEQVMAAFEYLGLVNRMARGQATKEEAVQAIEFLKSEMAHVARAAGISDIGQVKVDPLSGHPDLRKRVDDLDMTEDAAIELAQAREKLARVNAQGQQTQQQQAQQQAVQQARQAIGQWIATVKKTDLDWPALDRKLAAQLRLLIQGRPPSEWPSLVQRWYTTEKSMSKGTARRQETPLAPRGGATSSASAAPKSLHEAVLGAL